MNCRNLVTILTIAGATFASFLSIPAYADEPATAKPIDLSLPLTTHSSSPAKFRRTGLAGGARDVLKKTKPIDPPVDDATREGAQKRDAQNNVLSGFTPADQTTNYGATLPNLPGTPNVISPGR